MTDTIRAEAAARFLIAHRAADAVLPVGLPDELRPRSQAEAMAIQLATIAALGPVGGWKVGAPSATAMPVASPLPASGIKLAPIGVVSRKRGVEAEISFRFGQALPPRDRPYEDLEVLSAIDFCQAAIEIVDPRFENHAVLDPLTILADLGMHGSLVVGRPIESWEPGMFSGLSVELSIDGAPRRKAIGSNPAGTDLMRLLVWLANSEVARAFGGLAAGTYVTTGSWTGMEFVPEGGTAVARFDGFADVEVRFTG